jgi:hypothetical protein
MRDTRVEDFNNLGLGLDISHGIPEAAWQQQGPTQLQKWCPDAAQDDQAKGCMSTIFVLAVEQRPGWQQPSLCSHLARWLKICKTYVVEAELLPILSQVPEQGVSQAAKGR